MKQLLSIIQSLKLGKHIESLLEALVAPEKVSLVATESSKTKVKGFNIYGIQLFSKAQLMKDETFSALHKAIKAEDHLNIMINHNPDEYETPLIWIGPSSSNNQSKEDKQSLFNNHQDD